MTGFDNYKNNNYKQDDILMKIYDFFHKKFNFKVKRIIVNSLIAFSLSACVTFTGLQIYKKNHIKEAGIGGFETSAVPQFTEDLEESFSSQNVITGEDNLDLMAQVFDEDEAESQDVSSLELCYSIYRIKSGDMIGFIADRFGVTQDTIISVNNIRQSRNIQIGQYLKIPSMPGIIYTIKNESESIQSISDKYEISAEKCARVNSLSLDAKLTPGKTLFLPDAELDWTTRQEINGDLFHKPIKARYYLSSRFGWRASPFTGKRSYHSGVDMACSQGTNVYAALAGTVTTVGYNSVYGNYIIITHHSGYKTLYGHLSATLVTKGAKVLTDTRIGKVGSTGMSTGPHLHFTVFKFGKTVDPQLLWR